VFDGRRRAGHERERRPGGGRPERLVRLHVLQLTLREPGQRRRVNGIQVQRFGVGHQVADGGRRRRRRPVSGGRRRRRRRRGRGRGRRAGGPGRPGGGGGRRRLLPPPPRHLHIFIL